MVQDTVNLENRVFPGKNLTYRENSLLEAGNLTLFYLPKDDSGDAIVRLNLEIKGRRIMKDLQTVIILNDAYRNDKNAQKRYKNIVEKLTAGKYELDLGLPGVYLPSIKFL